MTRQANPSAPWPENADRAWKNRRFCVIGIPYTWHGTPGLWLQIQRWDGRPAVSWAEKQRIKNELAGRDALAFEVFPPEHELNDSHNVYHLWVVPADFELPTAWENDSAEFVHGPGLTHHVYQG